MWKNFRREKLKQTGENQKSIQSEPVKAEGIEDQMTL